MDCRNNPCDFAIDRGGQRTQGRCRCWDGLPSVSRDDRRAIRGAMQEAQGRIAALEAENAKLRDERDEAKRVAVWAVRNQVEALGVPPQVDIFVFGRHRTRCDGTPAGIIDALHRVRAAERLVELI